MLDLEDILDRRAAGLTADGKQKISLGRGLVRSDVNVIMFDEPLTVIDPHLKWQLRSKLKELHQRIGAHHDLRDPRPDRGADVRRQGGGHARGHRGADRDAGRAVRAAAPHIRRPFHRLARHERPALRGRDGAACGSAGRSPVDNPPAARLDGKRSRSACGPSSSAWPTRACRSRSSRSATPAATASSRRGQGKPPQAAGRGGHAGPAGGGHVRFDPAYTRLYADGWLVE